MFTNSLAVILRLQIFYVMFGYWHFCQVTFCLFRFEEAAKYYLELIANIVDMRTVSFVSIKHYLNRRNWRRMGSSSARWDAWEHRRNRVQKSLGPHRRSSSLKLLSNMTYPHCAVLV